MLQTTFDLSLIWIWHLKFDLVWFEQLFTTFENVWIWSEKFEFDFKHGKITQWSKMKKIFQRGESPKFAHFPSETNLVMVKWQKLAKSVGRNWGFWINSDFKESRLLFRVLNQDLYRWRFEIYDNILLIFVTLHLMACNQ